MNRRAFIHREETPMATRPRPLLTTLVALATLAVLATSAFAQKATVTFLHLNDVYELSPKDGKGGFAPLVTLLKQERAAAPGAITTLGGDLIASSMMSGITKGTQMIELMNAIGLDISAVGNHEFDEGVDELLRMQNGGCHPVDGCQDGDGFDGASFQYLAANVVKKSNGKPILPAYKTRSLGGAKIGFIGLTLEGTASIVSPSEFAVITGCLRFPVVPGARIGETGCPFF